MFKNTMKTTALLAGLGGLIVAVAGLIGGGSSMSLTIGVGIAFVMVGGSYWFSDKLALMSAKAKVIERADAPEFYDIVASLAQRANMPMPQVAVSPSDQPNAFATGRGPKHAVVCATTGLLSSMPRNEIEGVMAHELMHVKHRDILIGSIAAAIATAISYVAQMAMFASMFGGRDDDDEGTNPLAMLLMVILAPIAASLIQMAISRSREFEADRGAAELLGNGGSLADALGRIEQLAARRPMMVAPAQAQAYIHDPMSELRGSRNANNARMARLFSTHPDTAERIARLRAM
ncbi:MAG: M48 family metalloprotease [Actinomycetota bacterium]|nr:M48 family metalloprotease [Actinomycetota bacterium]